MRFISSVCLCCALLLALSALCYAGEKDELAWKGRALVAEYQLQQSKFNDAQTNLQTYLKELETKGLQYKDGQVIEKPKPKPPEPKAEPPKK